MAYQALVKMPNYNALPEPDEALQLKAEWLKDNDPVVEFLSEYLSELGLDFIPFDFAYENYKIWLSTHRPSTSVMNSRQFNKHLTEVAELKGEWVRPMTGKTPLKLPCSTWIPNQSHFGNAHLLRGSMRGIVRKAMWDYYEKTKLTPAKLGDQLPSVRASLGIFSGDDFSSEED